MSAPGIAKRIASVTTFHRNDKILTQQNLLARDKTKTLHKTQFSKIKTHLKLSSKSVGQGRGGMEGTMRLSKKTIPTWKSFVKNSMIRFCVHDTLYDTLENYKGNLKFMRNKKQYLMKNEIYLLFF